MRRLPYYLGALTLLAFLIGSYVVYAHFHYVAPPGGDIFNHAMKVRELQEQGISAFFGGYPKLFHALVLFGMHLTGKDALRIMLAYLPLIVAAAGLVGGLLIAEVRRQPWAGFLAMVLVVFVAQQPLQTLYDGGFPNYLSVAVWLPLVLWGVALLERGRKTAGLVAVASGSLLMLLTHHFSASYLVILAVAAGLLGKKQLRIYTVFFLIGLVVLLISPLGAGVRALLENVVQFGGVFPWIHPVGTLADPDAILALRGYPEYFTPLIWWAGTLTMASVIIARLMGSRHKVPQAVQLLVALALVLLICSQMPVFGFPIRLARDAGVPLVLLAAYGICSLGKLVAKVPPVAVFYWIGIGLLALPLIVTRLDRLRHFEPNMQYTPAQEAIAEKIGNASGIAIDQLLPNVGHPNIYPFLPHENGHTTLAEILRSVDYAMINDANPYLPEYEPILEAGGYRLQQTISDPLNTERLYVR